MEIGYLRENYLDACKDDHEGVVRRAALCPVAVSMETVGPFNGPDKKRLKEQ